MRLIDADKFKCNFIDQLAYMGSEIKVYLNREETICTESIRQHGQFKLHRQRRTGRNATYKCSCCGKLCSSYYNDLGIWNYCPHCGSKMDLEHDNENN